MKNKTFGCFNKIGFVTMAFSKNDIIESVLSDTNQKVRYQGVVMTRADAYYLALREQNDLFGIQMQRFGYNYGCWVGTAVAAGNLPATYTENNRETVIRWRRNILRKLGINGIIACVPNPEMTYVDDGIEYLVVPITDEDNEENRQILTSMMPTIMEFVKNHNVLIHCDFDGVSRCATVAIAIQIAPNCNFRKAYMHLFAKRPCSNPVMADWLETL